jgi:hypothetical protein
MPGQLVAVGDAVEALILVDTLVSNVWTPDHPVVSGWTHEQYEALVELVATKWGRPGFLAAIGAAGTHDPEDEERWDRYFRTAASPAIAAGHPLAGSRRRPRRSPCAPSRARPFCPRPPLSSLPRFVGSDSNDARMTRWPLQFSAIPLLHQVWGLNQRDDACHRVADVRR